MIKVEVRELMDDNEMLSHIFLGCIEKEDIRKIKDKFIGTKDWRTESVKLPVTMTIGGVDINPKGFFETWKKQMQRMIRDKAEILVAEKLGSKKMRDMQDKLNEFEQVLLSWEGDINWDIENPLIEKDEKL